MLNVDMKNLSQEKIKDILSAVENHEMVEFATKPLILASGSKARREIMDESGLPYVLIPNTLDEEEAKEKFGLKENLSQDKACEYVKWLSKEKAKTISKNVKNAVILAGDTVVFFNKSILEKPKTKEAAEAMLRALSNNVHKIISGVTIIDTSTEKLENFSVISEVRINEIENELLSKLVEDSDTYTHAGAYNISGILKNHIKVVSGYHDNAKGFPLELIKQKLANEFLFIVK